MKEVITVDENSKKRRINPAYHAPGLNNSLKNGAQEWDIIESDVLGSYTGTGYFDEYPVQDADDI